MGVNYGLESNLEHLDRGERRRSLLVGGSRKLGGLSIRHVSEEQPLCKKSCAETLAGGGGMGKEMLIRCCRMGLRTDFAKKFNWGNGKRGGKIALSSGTYRKKVPCLSNCLTSSLSGTVGEKGMGRPNPRLIWGRVDPARLEQRRYRCR